MPRKHQTPNTKHQRSSKHQHSNYPVDRFECLKFGVSLEHGVWCLVFRRSYSITSGSRQNLVRYHPHQLLRLRISRKLRLGASIGQCARNARPPFIIITQLAFFEPEAWIWYAQALLYLEQVLKLRG